MVSIISLISVALGAYGAMVAERNAPYQDFLEIGAGACLICGLALLGCSLPVIP